MQLSHASSQSTGVCGVPGASHGTVRGQRCVARWVSSCPAAAQQHFPAVVLVCCSASSPSQQRHCSAVRRAAARRASAAVCADMHYRTTGASGGGPCRCLRHDSKPGGGLSGGGRVWGLSRGDGGGGWGWGGKRSSGKKELKQPSCPCAAGSRTGPGVCCVSYAQAQTAPAASWTCGPENPAPRPCAALSSIPINRISCRLVPQQAQGCMRCVLGALSPHRHGHGQGLPKPNLPPVPTVCLSSHAPTQPFPGQARALMSCVAPRGQRAAEPICRPARLLLRGRVLGRDPDHHRLRSPRCSFPAWISSPDPIEAN